ncbi:MAG: hypothetical protein ACXAB7_06055 [Candidatus Kariarchaeaceae archaeon]|jgi:hypothetical protein
MYDQREIANVTLAYMTVIDKSEIIELPQEFIKELHSDLHENAILIYTKKTKILRIVPTKGNTVAKVNVIIRLEDLTPDFVKEIGAIFDRLGLTTVYATGLCFTEEQCVYEGYFDSSEFELITPEKIESEIKDAPGVNAIDIEMFTAQ